MKRPRLKAVFSAWASLRWKLLSICLSLLILPSLFVGVVSYEITKRQLEEAGRVQLKQDVQHVFTVIEQADRAVKAGRLTPEAAQEQVREEVLGPKGPDGKRPINPRFAIGTRGYIFAVNDHAVNIMHPTSEGLDLWDKKTQDGVMLGREYIRLVNQGGGYLTYAWPYPNSQQVGEKIVYIQKDPVWGWNVAAGSYLVDFNAPAQQVLRWLAIVIVCEIVAGVAVSVWLSRRIAKPVEQMTGEIQRIAEGDLRVQPAVRRGRDEIARLSRHLAEMTETLRATIQQTQDGAQQLAAASEQLAASAEENMRATEQVAQTAQDVAGGTDQQVHAVTSGREVVGQVVSTIRTIRDHGQDANKAASDAAGAADDGLAAVRAIDTQMRTIHETVQQLAAAVEALGERSQAAGQIVEVITQIAEQTNLLALNAAIEAARAGEQGRSFAVVAGEVRKLAEHSASSAEEVARIIAAIQDGSRTAAQAMRTGTDTVAAGLATMQEVGRAFERIRQSVSDVHGRVSDVSEQANHLSEHAEGLEAVMREIVAVTDTTAAGMQTVSAATEEQLAAMQEISASAQSLSQLAERLQALIARFQW
ncbi:methyl-accepting chemotaxis protein [Alicyclobacillus sp.]|uniref:methyl-accepting chemotaxis protein n=1 Tax=Alicyclobacillus sp. TaxID=61169 RepID=UPI0025C66D80|nr:methyl-accepting chemotaxis protein [Alicyclobacillus sp.]MCL6516819.1 methyl-accepting chemotaxis protein [Alicyclobacillus sp.]